MNTTTTTMPNMNGYPTPNNYGMGNASMPYYGGYGQVQPPYIPPTQTFRPQPVQQTSQLTGRMVAGPNDITPQEIPMDGSVSLFPQSDQSCIYAKSWKADGTIETVRYIREVEKPVAAAAALAPDVNDFLKDITDRLERIEKNTSYRKKPYNPNKNQPTQSMTQGTEDSNV